MSSPPSTRLFVPSAAVLVAALALSVFAHFEAWGGLGVLRAMLANSARNSSPSSEIEIVLSDPPESPTPHDDLAPELQPTVSAPEPIEHRERRPRHEREPRHPRTPTPTPRTPTPTPPTPTPVPTPTPAVPPPPPQPAPPPPDQRAAVDQHSQNPDQPNEDAQFISDEANTVEEETVAQITSATHDDEHPNPAVPDDPTPAETPGDSAEQLAADMRDTTGSDERRPTPDEAARDDPDDATIHPSHTLRPQAAAQGTDATSSEEEQVESGSPSLGDEGGTRALGGQPMVDVMVSDGFGSYTVRVPVGAAGDGGGTTGGHHREGSGLGTAGHGVYAGHVGHEGGSPREHGEGQREGPQLGLTYTQVEAVYGEEELERERHARLERRRSRARGSSADVIWDRFRAAMENYIAEVRPGNQTALNAASSPFARFLHDMHVRIHGQYVEHYLASLSLNADDPLNNMNMHMTLEIAVNPDGSIYRVGVLETSGLTLFDLGAFTAVWRAAPFPHPPSIILSGDGHAWLHWRFDRGPRQCGTWNAEPFLLDNGDTTPATTTDMVDDGDLPPDLSGDGSPIEMVPMAPTTPSTGAQ